MKQLETVGWLYTHVQSGYQELSTDEDYAHPDNIDGGYWNKQEVVLKSAAIAAIEAQGVPVLPSDIETDCEPAPLEVVEHQSPQPLSDEQKDAVLSDVVDMLAKQHDWLTRTSAINLVAGLYGRAGSVLARGTAKE